MAGWGVSQNARRAGKTGVPMPVPSASRMPPDPRPASSRRAQAGPPFLVPNYPPGFGGRQTPLPRRGAPHHASAGACPFPAQPTGAPVTASTFEALARRLDPHRPVLVAGPTASGKSALAAAIARHGGGVIVNADALQVFRCWRVLTARPSLVEEAALPHALYGHVPCDADYSVGAWLREVAPLLAGGTRPILVGGTGLYLSALTVGLAVIPPVPPQVRAEAAARLAGAGAAALLAELDPATAASIDQANPVRVQRAWEVWRATGRGLAAWQAETPRPVLPLAAAQPLLLEVPREILAARIAARFEAMLAAGALDEVRAESALDEGHAHGARGNPRHPSARAIGAAELRAHLDGRLSLEAARDRAVTATRQYAKRQRTWFRARMHAWPRLALGPDGWAFAGAAR